MYNEGDDVQSKRIKIGLLQEYKQELEKRINEDLFELRGVISLIVKMDDEIERLEPTFQDVRCEQCS